MTSGEFGRRGHGRILPLAVLSAATLLLAACNHNPNTQLSSAGGIEPASAANKPAPRARPAQTAHRPQKPAAARETAAPGRKDASAESNYFSTVGVASWYGADFHGRRTANGEIYDMHALTAAHPTLPLHSAVRVTNLANQRSLVVRVNDRGPYVGQRVIDVSAKTAQLLGFYDRGLARVKVEYVGRAPQNVAGSKPVLQASAQ